MHRGARPARRIRKEVLPAPGPRLAALLLGLWMGGAALSAGSPRSSPPPPAPEEREDLLADLRRFEHERRAGTDFLTLPPSGGRRGADPYRLRGLGPEGAAGVLRGRGELVVFGPEMTERARFPVPDRPTGLAVAGDRIFVSGAGSDRVAVFSVGNGAVAPRGEFSIDGFVAVRDVDAGPEGLVYAVDEITDRLAAIRLAASGAVVERRDCFAGEGPIGVRRAGRYLVVNALIGHELRIHRVDAAGWPEPEPAGVAGNDGPFWGFAPATVGSVLWIAAGGVEDRPLDRSGGFFGHVDSFCYLYRLAPGDDGPTRAGAVNVSEHGCVTPKALRFEDPDALRVAVAGYGSATALRIAWTETGSPAVEKIPFAPGANDLLLLPDGSWAAANPLLDAWTLRRGTTVSNLREGGREPGPLARMGEALFFTTLMAPENRSAGAESRFTCETCHFEGYGDGRTHYTGRGAVHATTKPLLGLFNNKPHFSRALDRDLTQMVNNEFRVAGAASGLDPWFSVEGADHPWLADHLGAAPAEHPPQSLRRALMTFLMAFTHDPNPRTRGRTAWTPGEREGARLFERHCEGCHGARAVADAPLTRVPFARWEDLTLSPAGPIVWASGAYVRTGVEPYMHPEGTRVPSLRRLEKKRPYFTGGSARSLEEVLEAVRLGDDRFFHAPPAPSEDLHPLTGRERAALAAFLRLL